MPPSSASNRPHRKTSKRFNTPGHAHYLTFSCFHRQPFLSRDRPRQWLTDSIATAIKKHAFRLIAYVFMPEHVHLLILPTTNPYDISEILHSIKQPVGRNASTFIKTDAPDFAQHMRLKSDKPNTIRFWQAAGGYDRNIYTAEELWEKINYIHNNPVKRKLVTNAVDWIWSSAADYASIRSGPLPVDNHNLPWTK